MVRYLGVIFTPSESPTAGSVSSTRGRPCRSLRRGLNAEARLPPPVSMALFPDLHHAFVVLIYGPCTSLSNWTKGLVLQELSIIRSLISIQFWPPLGDHRLL